MPDALSIRLVHAILSHHGEPAAQGAPVAGRGVSTVEALILAHADRMDALVDEMNTSVGFARMAGERWTDSRNGFHTPLFVPEGPTGGEEGAARGDVELRSA